MHWLLEWAYDYDGSFAPAPATKHDPQEAALCPSMGLPELLPGLVPQACMHLCVSSLFSSQVGVVCNPQNIHAVSTAPNGTLSVPPGWQVAYQQQVRGHMPLWP